MISAEFRFSDRAFQGFTVQGHAGFAPAPHDIVCAAVSAMAALTVNTLGEVFQIPLSIRKTEEPAFLDVQVEGTPGECADGVLKGFYLQMRELEKQYPKLVSVTPKKLK